MTMTRRLGPAALLLSLSFCSDLLFVNSETYANCGLTEFYTSLDANRTAWTREDLQGLLKTRHNAVPFPDASSGGTGDIWEALKQLDRNEGFSIVPKVRLMYADEEINADPFGGNNDWKAGHIWALLRGIGPDGNDYADVHNIRPVTNNANTIRSQTTGFFGQCEILEEEGACQTPAEYGASDTCKCADVYQPSMNMRGEIARALLYMDLRYDGSDPNTRDLRLTDCPFDATRDMGYLSQMMDWNTKFPPTDREKARNDAACTDWQGNRNPFIDYPDLADNFHPAPQPLPTDGEQVYEICEGQATNAPGGNDGGAENECDKLSPGDIYVYLLNSNDPDEVGFFNFRDLPEGLVLYMTDNAWDGLTYRTNEGIVKLTVPSGGIPAGTIFGYGSAFESLPAGGAWTKEEGAFSLSEEGDQVFVYCFTGDNKVSTKTGFSYAGPFLPEGLADYGLNQSALPPELSERGGIALPHFDNYIYNGPSAANQANCNDDCVKAGLEIITNYAGNNNARYSPPQPSGAMSMHLISLPTIMLALFGLVAMV